MKRLVDWPITIRTRRRFFRNEPACATFITRPGSAIFAARLQEAGLLMIPAGPNVLRLLPALNLTRSDAEEGLATLERVVAKLGA
jgi:acetylornithine/succinyldiaminopimelate/putrescine aminotransferase